MAGSDTVRGIAYQQAQAVAEAVALLNNPSAGALRVEGMDDVVDVEVFTTDGRVVAAKQIKIRADEYTWSGSELAHVLKRWAELTVSEEATFEFVTDGRIGPSGEVVSRALDAARAGDTRALSRELDLPSDSAVVRRLSAARIRRDPVRVETLLLRVQREIAAMLPTPMSCQDTRDGSRAAVDRLFRLLLNRASLPAAEDRVVDRVEIAAELGVPANQPAGQRWPGTLRERYLSEAEGRDLSHVTPPFVQATAGFRPRLRRTDHLGATASTTESLGSPDPGDAEQDIAVLLGHGRVSLVAGPTGSGKSTACWMLVRDAARLNRVALLGHAEAYLAGKLTALIADAVADVCDEAMPTVTGRQVLSDRAVTVILDGASEIPLALRDALTEDLRVLLATQGGPSVVLAGRDIAVLASLLPSHVYPNKYVMTRLNRDQRFDLVRRLLADVARASVGERSTPPCEAISQADQPNDGPEAPDATESAKVARVQEVLTQIDAALGDAADNPMLLGMATSLIEEGVQFRGRAALYERCIERLAERVGVTHITTVAKGLGIAYAALLNEGRRYADQYEWERLLDRAALALDSRDMSGDLLRTSALRSGLVTPMWFSQTLVPLHDSFADYLAGSAHAAGLAPLPTALVLSDEQRMLFAGEVGGVSARMALMVARDLPFLTVGLARHDLRVVDDQTPEEVQSLLSTLMGAPGRAGATPDAERANVGVCLWRQIEDSRIWAFAYAGAENRWITDVEAQGHLRAWPSVTSQGGPLDIAARLWRQGLQRQMTVPQTLPLRPRNLDDAVAALEAHTGARAVKVRELLSSMFSVTARAFIEAQLGPLGLTARIHPEESRNGHCYYPVSYGISSNVDIAASPNQSIEGGTGSAFGGRTTIDWTLHKSPSQAAADDIGKAINGLAGRSWL